jgi:hypothetical protein
MAMVCIHLKNINLKFCLPKHPDTSLRAQGCENPLLFLDAKGAREQKSFGNAAQNNVFHINKSWTKDGAPVQLGYGMVDPEFESRHEQELYAFSKTSKPTLGYTHCLIQ